MIFTDRERHGLTITMAHVLRFIFSWGPFTPIFPLGPFNQFLNQFQRNGLTKFLFNGGWSMLNEVLLVCMTKWTVKDLKLFHPYFQKPN